MPKFSRENGDRYVFPQRYADETFPVCPICGSKDPLWSTAYKYRGLLKYYLLKCSKCNSILSVSEADMTGLSFTTTSVQGQWKKGNGKESREVYIRVDEVGLDITDPSLMRLEKKELPVEKLIEYGDKVRSLE
ncbi:MAG: hypothetical protein GX671_06530 [Clostridiales bacterium]|nr:hypothetical protein [Clostridiales bacterium]